MQDTVRSKRRPFDVSFVIQIEYIAAITMVKYEKDSHMFIKVTIVVITHVAARINRMCCGFVCFLPLMRVIVLITNKDSIKDADNSTRV